MHAQHYAQLGVHINAVEDILLFSSCRALVQNKEKHTFYGCYIVKYSKVY